jgi:hypothetical protein
VPSDFYERLAINVQKPWEILLVEAHDPPVSSVWHRVNDQKFEADPMLINPADTLRVSVYLTNMDVDRPTQDQINASLPTWSTHIMNLRSITVNKNILSEEAQRMWGVTITLYGWSLVITLVLSILFMAEYAHLLYETRIKSSKQWVVVVWLVVVGFLSVAASESIATYVAPTLMLRLTGISALINVPFIAANLFMLVYLWWEAYLARTKRGIVP